MSAKLEKLILEVEKLKELTAQLQKALKDGRKAETAKAKKPKKGNTK